MPYFDSCLFDMLLLSYCVSCSIYLTTILYHGTGVTCLQIAGNHVWPLTSPGRNGRRWIWASHERSAHGHSFCIRTLADWREFQDSRGFETVRRTDRCVWTIEYSHWFGCEWIWFALAQWVTYLGVHRGSHFYLATIMLSQERANTFSYGEN